MAKFRYVSGLSRWLAVFFLYSCAGGLIPAHRGSSGGGSLTPINLNLSVVPLYPVHGVNWNDYVKNDGLDVHSAGDVACVGNEVGYAACLHGGEMKKVALTNVKACGTLALTDALGVFTWKCVEPGSNQDVFFYSSGLKVGKGLRDLVDSTSFINNSVSLSGSVASQPYTGSSTAGAWWTNLIAPFPDNHQVTDSALTIDSSGYTAGTIFVAPSSMTSSGYAVHLDKISFVTLGTAVISYSGNSTGNCNGGGDYCLIVSFSSNFFWIEGNYDGNGGAGTSADFGVYISQTGFPRVNNISLKNNSNICLRLYQLTNLQVQGATIDSCGVNGALSLEPVSNSFLQNLKITNAGSALHTYNASVQNTFSDVVVDSSGYGLYEDCTGVASPGNNTYLNMVVTNATTNGIRTCGFGQLFSELVIANAASDGLLLVGGSTVFNNLKVYNSGGNGAYILSPSNAFVNAIFSNNAYNGINMTNNWSGSEDTHVINTVLAFNGIDGLYINDPVAVLNNVVSIGNSHYGLEDMDGQNAVYGNVAISDNGLGAIHQGSGYGPSVYVGNLLVDNATSCLNDAGETGITDTTCVPNGTSTATLFYKGSLLGDFIQSISSNDVLNQSDTNGVATFPAAPSTFDWINFDNPFRVWGKWANGGGSWGSGSGSILDFEIKSTATKIFNNTGLVTSQNHAFVAGASCPSEVDGSVTITADESNWSGFPIRTYLANAVEIIDPNLPGYSSAGNHDGFCESGESCIYTPNFGVYQGSGSLQECTFSNGTIANVKMYGFSANGI